MLVVKNVSVFYDGLQALFSVSLTARQEEFICILGPNGAGKSTLLITIMGMLAPAEGEILLEDHPVHGMQPHRVADMGIVLVPEEGWLFPQMNVRENLLMGAYPKGKRKGIEKQMELVFSLFPLLHARQKQLAETLSGGERQMLAVGRGLMGDPKLLMLDEPSLGLAPKVVGEIFEALARINREKRITVLLAEQNIFHALKLSRRGYLLENGRIAMEGPSEELLINDHIKRNYLGI
jgi:branched-chain amino acid transport system ATP-binding protein